MTGIRSRFIRTFCLTALIGAALFITAAPVFGQALPIAEALAAQTESGSGQADKTAKTTQAKPEKLDIDPLLAIGVGEADNYKPLTKPQRWELYWKSTYFSPGAFFGVVFPAALDQAGNVPPEWGGGMQGYGKRVASRFGQNAINNTIQHGGAALLGTDPRYIRSNQKGFIKRSRHAFAFVFVTYNNEGKIRPAIANIAGNYGSGLIQIAWYPGRYNYSGDGIRNGNMQMGMNALTNLILEFGPDLKKIFRRK